MTDTVAILNTIRATFADSDPAKFDINEWFNTKTGCGCIIGHSLTLQPLLSEVMGLRLHLYPGYTLQGLRSDGDEMLGFGPNNVPPEEDAAIELSDAIGISMEDAHYLFDFGFYSEELRVGPAGHREALRRLDEVIARYSVAATPAVERVPA